MVELVRWPPGTGTAEENIAETVVELVRWPPGTGTAEENIAETAPRGWDSKVEYYGFIGGGCCGVGS